MPEHYQQAFNQFLPLAEQGDVNAQTYIGLAYLNGDGTKQDYVKPLHWLPNKAMPKPSLPYRSLAVY